MNPTMSRAEVEADIKQTLGLVPHFFSAIPDELLAPEWKIFKRMELGQTLIPNKYKELIGVGLHAETKCHYCTLFHTEAARLFGATDEEIQEAVVVVVEEASAEAQHLVRRACDAGLIADFIEVAVAVVLPDVV